MTFRQTLHHLYLKRFFKAKRQAVFAITIAIIVFTPYIIAFFL